VVLGLGLADKIGVRPGHEIVDHYTYGIVSDGDLMEGVSHEAASLAGHLKLGKLVYFYDDNHISIDGSTDLSFTEKRTARFEAYGWHVQQLEDGTDLQAIEKALTAARNERERPSLIAVRTHIGYGSPNKQDTASAHGEPLGPDEVKRTKEHLGWPLEPECFIPQEALDLFREALDRGKAWEASWEDRFESYKKAHPELAQEWERWMRREPEGDWSREIPTFPEDSKGMATRVASGHVLTALAPNLPNLIGGSADLAPSNKTIIKGEDIFQAGLYTGRNFHFGVREHGMGSVLNGMALHGGLIPYGGTFLIFSDYMRPAIRLASMMELKVIYIFTHDSIGLGEDGPTHQPIEQLAGLRAIPHLTVIRPCDANETAEAWRVALTREKGPFALILTRQGLPTLDRRTFPSADSLTRGAYILRDVPQGEPELILIASGSEVAIVLEAAEHLHQKGVAVRVVSMPSWELFEEQAEAYRHSVLPPKVKARIAVEAGATQGWHRYVGSAGAVIGLDHFGASAPYKILYEQFGLTPNHVVEKALDLLHREI
jgi:transketolase